MKARVALGVGGVDDSAELSRSLKVSDRRRNTPKSGQNRSESLFAGVWAACRIFWAWFGAVLGPIPVRNRRFPAGSLTVAWALLTPPHEQYPPLKPYKSIGFEAMDVTKPHDFIGFGVMDVTKPYEFIWFSGVGFLVRAGGFF